MMARLPEKSGETHATLHRRSNTFSSLDHDIRRRHDDLRQLWPNSASQLPVTFGSVGNEGERRVVRDIIFLR